jgi:Zn-dependent protease with chaperone function
MIWNLKPVADPELRERLQRFCCEHRLNVVGIRVWNTDNQIMNAMVAGFVPGFRMIILTDAMLSRFPGNELFAILRHEAGHIRLWHMPIRVSFILLPLLVLAVGEYVGFSAGDKLNAELSQIGITVPAAWLAPSIAYTVYLAAALGWLSRKMEYEADLYAATHSTIGLPMEDAVSVKTPANEMLDALLRFASYFPQQLHRRSFLHPSLSARMRRIAMLRDGSANREQLTRIWQLQQVFFLILLLTLSLAAVIV